MTFATSSRQLLWLCLAVLGSASAKNAGIHLPCIAWDTTYTGPNPLAMPSVTGLHFREDGDFSLLHQTRPGGVRRELYLSGFDRDGRQESERKIPLDTNDNPRLIKMLGDTAMILMGEESPFATAPRFWLSRMHTDGTVRWKREMLAAMRPTSLQFTFTADGGFMWLANSLQTLVRSDSLGDTLWTFSTGKNISAMAELPDGSVILQLEWLTSQNQVKPPDERFFRREVFKLTADRKLLGPISLAGERTADSNFFNLHPPEELYALANGSIAIASGNSFKPAWAMITDGELRPTFFRIDSTIEWKPAVKSLPNRRVLVTAVKGGFKQWWGLFDSSGAFLDSSFFQSGSTNSIPKLAISVVKPVSDDELILAGTLNFPVIRGRCCMDSLRIYVARMRLSPPPRPSSKPPTNLAGQSCYENGDGLVPRQTGNARSFPDLKDLRLAYAGGPGRLNATLSYTLPESGGVIPPIEIGIYNQSGRQVAWPESIRSKPGVNVIDVKARNGDLRPGIHFIRIRSEAQSMGFRACLF